MRSAATLFSRLLFLAAVLCGSSVGFRAPAVTLTFSTTAPVPAADDIFNFTGATRDRENVRSTTAVTTDGTVNDDFTYVAGDRSNQGQTFTTSNTVTAYVVKAVWLRSCGYTNNTGQTFYNGTAGGSFTVRITDPAKAGTAGFVLGSETYALTGVEPNNFGNGNSANGLGRWLKFTLATMVPLSTNKT